MSAPVYETCASCGLVQVLPTLPAGKTFGTARATEIVVAISDTGSFMDPRSCNEWWQVRPGYAGSCPAHE